MKKLITALFCFLSLHGFTQTPKWFVSLETGFNMGGPSFSIKSQMCKQDFDEGISGGYFSQLGPSKYPLKFQQPSILLKAGKQISEMKSVYILIGRLDKSRIQGNATDVRFESGIRNSLFFESNPEISYSIYQLAAGYLYTNPKSRTQLGIGPSVYLLNFTDGSEEGTSFTAGLSATSRTLLSKLAKAVRLEFIMEFNLAPPVKMEINMAGFADKFKMKSANMISLNFGLALKIHK
jgi:hypothetical protein